MGIEWFLLLAFHLSTAICIIVQTKDQIVQMIERAGLAAGSASLLYVIFVSFTPLLNVYVLFSKLRLKITVRG